MAAAASYPISGFPVSKVDGAVNVLNSNDGLGNSLHQELLELGIVVNLSELEVVDIIT